MSKLTREEAKVQAARIMSCPMLAPQTKEGKQEIVDCFLRHCQNAEHAAAVMTQVLDSAMEVKGPLTAWIAAIAKNTAKGEPAPAGCWRCEIGPDVETGEMRYANHIPTEWKGYTCARRCLCVRGQWMTRKDRERAADAPQRPHASVIGTVDDWAKRAARDI